MTINKMKNKALTTIFLIGLVTLLNDSCTKLKPHVYDRVENFWRTPDQIAAGIAPAYIDLRGYAPVNSLYDLNEVSSDEIIVPTRGSDWYDNGVWEKMWKHTWAPDVFFFEDGWQFVYGGIARVNSILQAVDEIVPRPLDSVSIKAELKMIRAFYYYVGIDLFGNIPIVLNNNISLSQLTNKSRTEVFAYIENEIRANLSAITDQVSLKTYGRATKWFAEALLAKLYLNASVYTGTPRWADCIAACDAILHSNQYSLEPNFFANFTINNEGSKENIFVIPFDVTHGLNYFWLQGATLHYFSWQTFGLDGVGFNGHCSTAEYYNLFDSNDTRRKTLLVGQQYVDQIKDSAHLQYDRSGQIPLNFDPNIKTFSIPLPQGEVAGARCAKWEFNKHGGGLMSNDFTVFRLADIILMKAEAQLRNGDVAGALATINQKINGVSIRSRANLPDFSISEMNLDGLLKERARELSWEGWRRNDMIRFGHFTDARVPEKLPSGAYRNLYPIPQPEMDKNPYLKQNTGY